MNNTNPLGRFDPSSEATRKKNYIISTPALSDVVPKRRFRRCEATREFSYAEVRFRRHFVEFCRCFVRRQRRTSRRKRRCRIQRRHEEAAPRILNHSCVSNKGGKFEILKIKIEPEKIFCP